MSSAPGASVPVIAADLRLARTIGDVMAPSVATQPDHEALRCGDRSLTYAQLDAAADQAAAKLHALGIRPGDRIAASLPNSIEVVVAFHATARLGAIWVGVNKLLAAPEQAFILRDCGASVLLGDGDCLGRLAGQDVGPTRLVAVDPLGGPSEWQSLAGEHLDDPLGDRPEVDIAPSSPAAIAYTSGTTGFPKGVVHSHRNLLTPAAVHVVTRGYDQTLRKADWLPFTIVNVASATTLFCCQAGGTQIAMDTTSARIIADTLAATAATVFQGAPALLHTMVADPTITPEHLATVVEVFTGGAPTTEKLQHEFLEKFGRRIIATYGLTEAPQVLTLDPQGDDGHVHGGSGLPYPHVDVFAADDEGGRLPDGDVGEICVAPVTSGAWADLYTPMLGYWDRPDATASALRGGVLHTGDVGRIGERGFLFVTDRKNAMIIRGGSNVYPAEVERVIATLPGIVDVSVVGVPDERLGERVGAAVQLMPGTSMTAGELRAALDGHIAPYKIPERIVFVDGFPRNSMNKIVRAQLLPLFTSPG